MVSEIVRKDVDRVDDRAFAHALRVWHELQEAGDALTLIRAIQGRCDTATNLYLTDLDPAGFWAYRMSIASHSFSLEHTDSFVFGDYPDRAYFAKAVQPCFHDLIDAEKPVMHRVKARILGKLAVYERLTLPFFARGGMDRSITVSKLLALVDDPGRSKLAALSVRERQCLSFLATGCSAKVIAAKLDLTQSAVEKHIERLKGKLGVQSAAQAAATAALFGEPLKLPSGTPPLSGRERQCLGHLASGLSVKETADRLRLSAKTVELQVAALKRKLAARNVAEAVALGIAVTFGTSRSDP